MNHIDIVIIGMADESNTTHVPWRFMYEHFKATGCNKANVTFEEFVHHSKIIWPLHDDDGARVQNDHDVVHTWKHHVAMQN